MKYKMQKIVKTCIVISKRMTDKHTFKNEFCQGIFLFFNQSSPRLVCTDQIGKCWLDQNMFQHEELRSRERGNLFKVTVVLICLKIYFCLWLFWVFTAVHQPSPVAVSSGSSLVSGRCLFTAVISLVLEHGLQVCGLQ